MVQEIFICVPYTKKAEKDFVERQKKVYKCQNRQKDDDKKENRDDNQFICHICEKSFKNERCLKIHKTKMDHWKSMNSKSSLNSQMSFSSSMFRNGSNKNKSSSKSSNDNHSNISNSQKRKKSNSPPITDLKKKLRK